MSGGCRKVGSIIPRSFEIWTDIFVIMQMSFLSCPLNIRYYRSNEFIFIKTMN